MLLNSNVDTIKLVENLAENSTTRLSYVSKVYVRRKRDKYYGVALK